MPTSIHTYERLIVHVYENEQPFRSCSMGSASFVIGNRYQARVETEEFDCVNFLVPPVIILILLFDFLS